MNGVSGWTSGAGADGVAVSPCAKCEETGTARVVFSVAVGGSCSVFLCVSDRAGAVTRRRGCGQCARCCNVHVCCLHLESVGGNCG